MRTPYSSRDIPNGSVVVEHFATIQNIPQAVDVKAKSNQSHVITFAIVIFVIALAVGISVAVSASSNAASLSAIPPDSREASIAFNIQLIYETPASDAEKFIFSQAVNRIQQVIIADFAATVRLPAGTEICATKVGTSDILVDDIAIFVSIGVIDNAGRVLGEAGPCGFDNRGNVRLGRMRFDEADFPSLIRAGTAQATVLHEMLHVLGVGTRWEENNLFNPAVSPFVYNGVNGNQGNAEIGHPGPKALIEDVGGAGTAGGHWKESEYDTELMTGSIGAEGAPFSSLTIRSLADLGYTVDVSKADTFTVSARRRRLRDNTKRVSLSNDILKFEMVILETIPKLKRKSKKALEGEKSV